MSEFERRVLALLEEIADNTAPDLTPEDEAFLASADSIEQQFAALVTIRAAELN